MAWSTSKFIFLHNRACPRVAAVQLLDKACPRVAAVQGLHLSKSCSCPRQTILNFVTLIGFQQKRFEYLFLIKYEFFIYDWHFMFSRLTMIVSVVNTILVR
jgi:hypothetical protein